MLIGVYRLYLSAAWPETAEAPDFDAPSLLRQLDAVPNFFYRRLETIPAASADADAQLVAARVGMTQAHVLVVPAAAPRPHLHTLKIELSLARQGFRRRIPILAIGAPLEGLTSVTCDTTVWADRTVQGCGPDIAFAIQDLVEEATAERRADQRDSEASLPAMGNGAPVAPQWPKAQPQPIQPGGSSDGMRVLPLEQIAASFEAYKAQRHHGR